MAGELGDELADGRVGERGLPAAVREGLAGILLRSAGGLHHAVEGQERLNGELHVNADEPAHRFSADVAARGHGAQRRPVVPGCETGCWRRGLGVTPYSGPLSLVRVRQWVPAAYCLTSVPTVTCGQWMPLK